MSDSDSLSSPEDRPADSILESSLRRAVRLAVKNGDNITVNLARSKAEEELGLAGGFFKDNPVWKSKSRDIVTEAAESEETPEKPTKAGSKRKSDEAHVPRKRSKATVPPSNRESNVTSAKSRTAHLIADDARVQSGDESALSEPPSDILPPTADPPRRDLVEDDESDLSSVIDDPPPKKRRSKKSTSPTASKARPSKSSKKSSKPNPKEAKELAPDEEEIKRLQSWLLKCGVRKLWHRELASYSTSKEKIRHLKEMLDDVGMTGRFSAEKAREIKEARELKAELEAAQEFNEQWGHDAASESENEKADKSNAPAKRARPKGLVDFGDSDDESE